MLDWSFAIVGICGLMVYLSHHSAELGRLRHVPWWGVGALSVGALLCQLLMAIKLQITARYYGAGLTVRESFWLIEAGAFMNILPLNLGTPFRAVYIKRVHRLRYVDFGMGMAAHLLIGLAGAGMLGGGALILMGHRHPALYALFGAYVVVPVIALSAPAWVVRGKGEAWVDRQASSGRFVGKLLSSAWRSYRSVVEDKVLLSKILLITLLVNFAMACRYWVAGICLGYPTGFAEGLVLQAVGRVSAAVTVVPSGTIGLREALTGLGSTGLGREAVEGTLIATLDRAVGLLWFVVLGSAGLAILRRRLAQQGSTEADGDVTEIGAGGQGL